MPADPLNIGELARALGAEEVLSLGDLHARMTRAERERDQFREALEVAVEGLRGIAPTCTVWGDGCESRGELPVDWCDACIARFVLARVASLVPLPEQAEEGR